MFGFTISKINLLILVFAMFLIVTYFMFGWRTVLIGYSAQQIVDKRLASPIYNKLNSESICDFDPVVRIPRHIEYFADVVSGGRYFYKVTISKMEPEGEKSWLLVKAVDRKDPDNVLATASFRTDAKIRLFEWVEDEDIKRCYFSEQDSIVLDPEGDMWGEQIPKDAVAILMERWQGEQFIYIIACSTKDVFCEENIGLVGCMIKKERGSQGACFSIDSCCEDDEVSRWSCGCGIGD